MIDIKKEKPAETYYTIEIDAFVPATLKYKILAESPEAALLKLNLSTPLLENPRYKFAAMKRIVARIYTHGTAILKYSKKF